MLLDCGFSCAETEKRLTRLGLDAQQVDAILVTHEHSDHISGVARFSRRFGIPVWMTAGTEAVHRGGEVAAWHCFSSHQPFRIGDLEIAPYPVPHDAREPCQFVIAAAGAVGGVGAAAAAPTPRPGPGLVPGPGDGSAAATGI